VESLAGLKVSVQLNKVAYVTGSSSGIGKALCEKLLDEGFHVIGISRRNEITHPNFEFVACDLSDLSQAANVSFPKKGEFTVLVNNAGVVGDIKRVGSIDNEAIAQVLKVNTIAPQILCNNFVNTFQNESGEYHLLNISSGAGKNAIDAWSSYCASKAALDLYSETIAGELDWMEKSNWKVHSCAPGVVDTQMQTAIRSANPDDFNRSAYFHDLKKNDELYSPKFVAEKLNELITRRHDFNDVIVSVRDF